MKTATFEQVNNKVYELRAQIANAQSELGRQLALLQQFADIVQIETRICKEDVNVVPSSLIEWENI